MKHVSQITRIRSFKKERSEITDRDPGKGTEKAQGTTPSAKPLLRACSVQGTLLNSVDTIDG